MKKNKTTVKDKKIYIELIRFLNETVEDELMNFYRDKNQLEKINKDSKCIFFDHYFRRQTGISLLEKNGFIKFLTKQT